MPQIVVLPHVELCPEGAVIDAVPGKSICDNLLDHGIEIEHACEKSCACTTCHVIVREGFDSLDAVRGRGGRSARQGLGPEPASRLSCQAIVADDRIWSSKSRSYTINHAKENH